MLTSLIGKNKKSGLTFIESLVGIALLLIVFVGIFGLVGLNIKIVAQSKAKAVATALANQKIELARNLTYDQIGTAGGIPSGVIPETENIERNEIAYTVKTTVIYVDDSFDGVLPVDPLAWDYKRIKVKVTWTEFFGGQVSLQTDIAPRGIETTGGGGIISVLIFDANGQPVPQTDIRLENDDVFPPIDAKYQTDDQGRIFIPGAPECNDCYKITASKFGFSSERTYEVNEIVRGVALAFPLKPFLSVIEGQLSEISFSIDHLSTKTVSTIRYVEEKNWSDSFNDEGQITEKFQAIVDSSESEARLKENGGQYQSSGHLTSVTITPSALVEWGRMNWNDENFAPTEIKYQILYYNGSDWILIPDSDLTVNGILNSDGFTDSPLDLAELDSYKYKSIRLKANFSTTDSSQTPSLFDWQVTWFSSDSSISIPNLAFLMRGAKTLGLDINSQPIYKYSQNLTTNSEGVANILNLEWDSYRVTVDSVTGYDIANSFPSQPINLNPDSDQIVILRLANHQANTFLVTVKNSAGQSLIGADIRLYKVGYDKSKLTSDSGQAFYSSLNQATYNLEIKMAGYQDWLSEVDVSGQSEQIIIMTTP
jgi:type II secretory pathway pseudopilin PulG